MSLDRIAAAHELPPALSSAVESFLDRGDAGVAEHLGTYGLPDSEVDRLSQLWSGYAICGTVSEELTHDLRAAGIAAIPVVNDDAVAVEVTVHGTGGADWRAVRHRRHVIVAAEVDGLPYYVDASWQQFLTDVGQTEADLESNAPWVTVPTERVLCYTPDEVGTVSEWFGLVARTIQDRHKTHNQADPEPSSATPLNTMYTRQFGVVSLIDTRSGQVPNDYQPVAALEMMARQIWDPANYRLATEEDYSPHPNTSY